MKYMIKSVFLILTFLLLVNCDGDEDEKKKTIYGKWVYTKLIHEESGHNRINEFEPEDHQFFSAFIIEIKSNTYSEAYSTSEPNNENFPPYILNEKPIVVDGNTISFTHDESDGFNKNHLFYKSSFSGSNLVLKSEFTTIEGDKVVNQYFYRKYFGEIPHPIWLQPISNDQNEPNNTPDNSKLISISKTKSHNTLTKGDIDWYHFSAKKDKTYIIRVNTRYSINLSLFESDGNTELISTNNIDSVDPSLAIPTSAKAAIEWTCLSDGFYLYKISGYKGYYTTHVYEK